MGGLPLFWQNFQKQNLTARNTRRKLHCLWAQSLAGVVPELDLHILSSLRNNCDILPFIHFMIFYIHTLHTNHTFFESTATIHWPQSHPPLHLPESPPLPQDGYINWKSWGPNFTPFKIWPEIKNPEIQIYRNPEIKKISFGEIWKAGCFDTRGSPVALFVPEVYRNPKMQKYRNPEIEFFLWNQKAL